MTSEQVMENLRHYVEESEHKTVAIFTPDGRSSGGVMVAVHVLEDAMKEITRLQLTPEEREAIAWFSRFGHPQNGPMINKRAATLRGLVKKTK